MGKEIGQKLSLQDWREPSESGAGCQGKVPGMSGTGAV